MYNPKFKPGDIVVHTDNKGNSYDVKILALPEPDKGSYYKTEAPVVGELYIPESMLKAKNDNQT